jgi:hypothetical protein
MAVAHQLEEGHNRRDLLKLSRIVDRLSSLDHPFRIEKECSKLFKALPLGSLLIQSKDLASRANPFSPDMTLTLASTVVRKLLQALEISGERGGERLREQKVN